MNLGTGASSPYFINTSLLSAAKCPLLVANSHSPLCSRKHSLVPYVEVSPLVTAEHAPGVLERVQKIFAASAQGQSPGRCQDTAVLSFSEGGVSDVSGFLEH
jgi:hypothetical protein